LVRNQDRFASLVGEFAGHGESSLALCYRTLYLNVDS
jgi:hypothetical protein